MIGRPPNVKMPSKTLPQVAVKRVSSEREIDQAFAIRIRVFVKEQGVPREIELDDDDEDAIHLLATIGPRAVGTARVVRHGGAAKIGRMAVLKSYRRKGVGMKLLTRALAVARRFPGRLDLPAIRAATTFEAFDDRVTAPLHGFAGARDYWARCSAGAFLAGVRRPLLALAAGDDPMVPRDALPCEAARHNPLVRLEVAPAGGHVGFVEGLPWRPGFWAERTAADFLAGQLRG